MRAIAVSLIVAVFALAGCASEQTETSPTAGIVAPATTGPAPGWVAEERR